MVKARMQIEILSEVKLSVKRKGLRYVSDVTPRFHFVSAHRFSEQLGLAFGHRQEPREHLHGCRLAATVRAEEAKDLPAPNPEAHMIDRTKISEAASQSICLD